MNIIQKRHIIAWSTTGTQNEALMTTPTLFFFYVLICDINLYYNRNVCRKRDLLHGCSFIHNRFQVAESL